jgi:prophage maintenance system killer protein
VRDMDLLESAVAIPQMTFDGVELNATVFDKAAALAFSLTSSAQGSSLYF